MGLRSRKEREIFGMINSVLEIENELDISNMLLARWDSEFLRALMDITADPETGKRPINQMQLSKVCGVSQKTVSNLLAGSSNPTWDSVEKIGRFFGIHFVADYNHSIDNQKVLEALKSLKDM